MMQTWITFQKLAQGMNLGSQQQDPEYMNNVKEHMIQKEMR